jgi:hypothetical protein
MKKMFDELFFDSAVGLGDAIVMNAIVHHYARITETLYYPARAEFFETIKCLYQDVPNIEVWRFYGAEQQDTFVESKNIHRIRSFPLITSEIHRIGCDREFIHVHWPQQVYENWDIPFKMRYLDFHLPKEIPGTEELYNQLTEGEEDYVLVHRYASDHPAGLPINVPNFRKLQGFDDMKIIEVQAGQTDNMLKYKTLIERAKEIHCIPSSFFNLVDSMANDISARLFFHDIRKNSLMKVNSRWNNHRWQIATYGVRM